MKPRRMTWLTDEDLYIWYGSDCPGRPMGLQRSREMSCNCDGWDAELMLDIMKTRTHFIGRILIRGRLRRAVLAYQGVRPHLGDL